MTPERWQHIAREHPELQGLYQLVLATIRKPSKILAGGQEELLAVGPVEPGKVFVVVYKETSADDGFVITAFFTKRIRQLEKRVVVWPRQ